MRISKFIAKLQSIQNMHGDLEVETETHYDGRCEHRGPEVAFQKKLVGRERRPAFWQQWEDPQKERKGSKVCRV